RCSPPALVLSLSPGLGHDGLPSPGACYAPGGASNAAPQPPVPPGGGIIGNGDRGNPPNPRGPASPCNELLAAAMRSSAAAS
ncbi:Ring finger proteinlike, partial [Caligus rogercresseyi]